MLEVGSVGPTAIKDLAVAASYNKSSASSGSVGPNTLADLTLAVLATARAAKVLRQMDPILAL